MIIRLILCFLLQSIVDARNAATVELVDCVFEGNVGLVSLIPNFRNREQEMT